MTPAQRAALLDLTAAILRCDCAPADIRFRARNLQIHIALDGALSRIFA